MIALVLAAGFPVIVFLIIIYKKDSEKEPPKLLFKCFLWGCIASLPIIVIELIVDSFNVFESLFFYSFYESFIVAAVVEEGFKFLFLFLIIWKHKEFDQFYDGIVYAVFVSLGFALVENILYVAEYGFGTAIMRAVLSVPGHGLFGVAMGYFFALAKFSGKRGTKMLWLSFLVPVAFHGLYNFLLSFIGGIENGLLILLFFAGFVALLILMWRTGIRFINKHYTRDLNKRYDF
jgi:RsiW-degrading membrane proteinase PrsW (M82 family)